MKPKNYKPFFDKLISRCEAIYNEIDYSALNEILLESRGLIKNIYGIDSEYFKEVNSIKYLDKHFGIIYNDGHYKHLEFYRSGVKSTIDLLKNIKFEEKSKMELEKYYEQEAYKEKVQYVAFISLLAFSSLCIWTMPENYLIHIFKADKLYFVKVLMTMSAFSLSAIVILSNNWKEMLGLFIGFLAILFSFLN